MRNWQWFVIIATLSALWFGLVEEKPSKLEVFLIGLALLWLVVLEVAEKGKLNIERHWKMHRETKRQLIHMSGAVTPFYLQVIYEHFSSWLAPEALVTGMLAIGYLIAHMYKRGVRIPVFATLVDMAEREDVKKHSPGKGTFRFFLGILATMLVFGSLLGAPFFVVGSGILVLALGDSMSTLAGRKIGRRKLPYNRKKSIEGSLLGTVYAFLGVLLYLIIFHAIEFEHATKLALVGAIAGMFVESLPLKVDDNFLIPLASGAAMYVMIL